MMGNRSEFLDFAQKCLKIPDFEQILGKIQRFFLAMYHQKMSEICRFGANFYDFLAILG